MKHSLRWLMALALVAVLAGCARTDGIDDSEMAEIDRAAATGVDTGAESRGAAAGLGLEGEALEDPSSPLSERIVYFEFDSSTLSSDAMALLEAHAAFLADNPQRRMLVEGHTDERGSREYNLALGERRAESVKQALTLAGARSNQIDTVSYGEESPAANGSNESAWSQNRRAELVYER